MVGKSVEKLFRKLSSKKYRWEMQLFIAEGPKVVQDIIDSGLQAHTLLCSDAKLAKNMHAAHIDETSLKNLSQLDTANVVLAIFPFPKPQQTSHQHVLVLDKINDPGNLGTIIRTCDWFGISKIYCTKGTADIYNSKCVQSTMGSIARIEVEYAEIEEIQEKLQQHKKLVAHMAGLDVLSEKENLKKHDKLALIMGSESHGPNPFWLNNATPITIPKKGNSPIESLNVAQAASIIISQLMA